MNFKLLLGYFLTLLHFVLACSIFYAVFLTNNPDTLFKLFVIISLILISFLIHHDCVIYVLEKHYQGNDSMTTSLKILASLLSPYKHVHKDLGVQVIIVGLAFIVIKFCLQVVQKNICIRR